MYSADELGRLADAAFKVASRKAIECARQAGHGIVIWRDGRVVEISSDEAEQLLADAEASDVPARIPNPESSLLHFALASVTHSSNITVR